MPNAQTPTTGADREARNRCLRLRNDLERLVGTLGALRFSDTKQETSVELYQRVQPLIDSDADAAVKQTAVLCLAEEVLQHYADTFEQLMARNRDAMTSQVNSGGVDNVLALLQQCMEQFRGRRGQYSQLLGVAVDKGEQQQRREQQQEEQAGKEEDGGHASPPAPAPAAPVPAAASELQERTDSPFFMDDTESQPGSTFSAGGADDSPPSDDANATAMTGVQYTTGATNAHQHALTVHLNEDTSSEEEEEDDMYS
ncbi:hypothetical protein RI367_001333 [Sorochytrium milnesiophthora]